MYMCSLGLIVVCCWFFFVRGSLSLVNCTWLCVVCWLVVGYVLFAFLCLVLVVQYVLSLFVVTCSYGSLRVVCCVLLVVVDCCCLVQLFVVVRC